MPTHILVNKIPWLKDIFFYRIDLDKRKLIQVSAAQGVLNKKSPGPVLKVSKPGINGIGKRKAVATNQIVSESGSVIPLKSKNCHRLGEKLLPFSVSIWYSCFWDVPCLWWPSHARPCRTVTPSAVGGGKTLTLCREGTLSVSWPKGQVCQATLEAEIVEQQGKANSAALISVSDISTVNMKLQILY